MILTLLIDTTLTHLTVSIKIVTASSNEYTTCGSGVCHSGGQIPRRTLAFCQIWAFSKPDTGNLLASFGHFGDTRGVLFQ